MRIRFHGHSCFEIHHQETKLIIDPFLSGNPQAVVKPEEIAVNYILVTHGHNDHVGDTLRIAKENKATVIAPFELATWLSWQGAEVHPMHIGGSYHFPFGRVKLTQAFHGSAYTVDETKEITYLGMPCGFLITLGNRTLYHAGDTALYSDMKLIGTREKVEVAMLPIGDNFTMGPDDASIAAEWVGAKQVIPMHYNTFPVIEQDPRLFAEKLQKKGIEGVVLKSGEWIEA